MRKQIKRRNTMANKFIGVTKAAIAGAVLGTAVGMVAVPSTKKMKKYRKKLNSNTGKALRTVGVAMQNAADILG